MASSSSTSIPSSSTASSSHSNPSRQPHIRKRNDTSSHDEPAASRPRIDDSIAGDGISSSNGGTTRPSDGSGSDPDPKRHRPDDAGMLESDSDGTNGMLVETMYLQSKLNTLLSNVFIIIDLAKTRMNNKHLFLQSKYLKIHCFHMK